MPLSNARISQTFISESLLIFFKLNAKFNVNVLLGFRIHSFATQTTLHLVYTISLPACKNHTIHHSAFILALNNAENIPLSENIIVVHVSFICVLPPPLPPYPKIDSWLTGVNCIAYTIQCRDLVPYSFD